MKIYKKTNNEFYKKENSINIYKNEKDEVIDNNKKLKKNSIGFWEEGYITLYPDVLKSKLSPIEHYLNYGFKEGRSNGIVPPKNLFNSDGYLSLYKDVKDSHYSAWEHYVKVGKKEGRSNCLEVHPDEFSDESYLFLNPDLKDKNINNLKRHYYTSGLKEGRLYSKLTYLKKYIDEKNNVFFSIILPTYNRKHVLGRAIDSVLDQTFTNYELIIVDDGSTDNTEDFLKENYKEYLFSKIFYVKIEHSGVCSARNHGLKIARYEWICYLDSDNFLDKNYLEIYTSYIVLFKDKCYYSRFKIINEDSEEIFSFKFDYKKIFKHNIADLGVFVHHRDIYKKFGGFDQNLRRYVDWDLFLRYTENNEPIFIPIVTLYYDNLKRLDRITKVNSTDQDSWNYVIKKNSDSIIACITTYNHKEYIEEALESALMQKKIVNYKIFIFDDASSDGTTKICERYEKKYKNIKLYVNKKNIGMASNMKFLLRKISCDYLAILEGDDVWIDCENLYKKYNFLKDNHKCSMVFSKLKFLYKNEIKEVLGQNNLTKYLNGDQILNFNGNNPIINFSTCFFVSRLIKKIPLSFFNYNFNEIGVSLFLERYGLIGYINECMSYYRIVNTGLYSGKSDNDKVLYKLNCRESLFEVAKQKYFNKISMIINQIKKQL